MSPPEAPAVAHFAAAAARYRQRSERGLWRLQRRREAAAVLVALGALEGYRALDLGCGAGHYTRAMMGGGAADVVAVDRSPAMLAALGGQIGVEPVVGDAEALQLDRRFDRIVCAGLLEFVDAPRSVLDRARAHAAPGCVMALLTAYRGVGGRLYRRYHRRHGIELRLFDPGELQRLAVAAGWIADAPRIVAPFSMVLRLRA